MIQVLIQRVLHVSITRSFKQEEDITDSLRYILYFYI